MLNDTTTTQYYVPYLTWEWLGEVLTTTTTTTQYYIPYLTWEWLGEVLTTTCPVPYWANTPPPPPATISLNPAVVERRLKAEKNKPVTREGWIPRNLIAPSRGVKSKVWHVPRSHPT